MKRSLIVFLVCFCDFVRNEFYDTYSGKEIEKSRYDDFNRLGLVPYCAIEVRPCQPKEPRRMDGSCNNLKQPASGAPLTPYRRLLRPTFSTGGNLPTARSGKPLPLARPLRVALMSDGRASSDRYTPLVVNFNVFVTGDITSVHDTVNYVVLTRHCCQPGGQEDPDCIPVQVLDNDLHLRRSNVRCMNLTRALTYQRIGCVSYDEQRERVNTATPLPDLSMVYGNDEQQVRKGRESRGGRLRSEDLGGMEWPPSGGQVCLNNEPPRETRCHDAPAPGVNSIIGLNIMFIWLFRSHNAIARELQKINPCWDDDQLFFTAREINIAYYNQIMYYDMMPVLLGWDFLLKSKVVYPTAGFVNDFDPTLSPQTSIEYVVGTRWFHVLQEGRMKLYTRDGRQYDEVAVVDMTLRTGALPVNDTIGGMTRGFLRQPGGAADALVDPDIGERVLGRLQFASDVLANDLMKGRDVGLPPYNHYRKLCGLPVIKKFKDLLEWMDQTQVEAMGMFYEHPDDIDLYAALLAERAMPGTAVGPTLGCIMAEQLLYWRRSDRFWYEHPDHPQAFTEEQLYEIRKMTMSKLICLHGDGVDAAQPNAFLVIGPGNEEKNCSSYEMPNLNVFKDDRCYPKPTSKTEHSFITSPSPYQQQFNNPETMAKILNQNYLNPKLYPSIPKLNEYNYQYDGIPVNQGYNSDSKLTYGNINLMSDKISGNLNQGYTNGNPFLSYLNY